MAGRAQVGAPGADSSACGDVVAQEVGAGGPEAHHGDVGAEPRHGQPPIAVAEADAVVDAPAGSFADGSARPWRRA